MQCLLYFTKKWTKRKHINIFIKKYLKVFFVFIATHTFYDIHIKYLLQKV